jgi:dihydrofolate reductase
MVLSIIVAAADNGVIGKDGKMPWRLPAESAYFKATTLGHPVITGRKNFEAMGRPLPDRLNVVITRQNYAVPDGAVVAHSLQEALALPEVKQADEIFVIGGQQIYDQAMPLTDKLYFTQIDAKIAGDTFFDYNPDEWRMVWSEKHPADEHNEYAFELRQLVRKS